MATGIDVDSCVGGAPTVMPAQPVSTLLFPQGKSWMAAYAAMTQGAVATGQIMRRLQNPGATSAMKRAISSRT